MDGSTQELDDARRKDIARRFRAARELAGYTSVPKFADALETNGLKRSTLYALQQGKWPKDGKEDRRTLRWIAEFCGLPPAWFDVDIAEAIRREAERVSPPDEAAAERPNLRETVRMPRARQKPEREADERPGSQAS